MKTRLRPSFMIGLVVSALACAVLEPVAARAAPRVVPHPATQAAILPGTSLTPPVVSATATARQRRIFGRLWRVVNERYVYPDFNGYDWQAARAEVTRRINAGMTDEQFYEAMRALIVNLNDDHSQFLSPDEARAEDAEYEGAGSYTGIGIVSAVNLERRYIYVLTVLPDSPAERSGIRPHDHVLEIDGQPTVDENGQARFWLLRGEAGTPVTLRVRTPGQQPRLLELRRAEVTSVERIERRLIVSPAGNRRVGYLSVPSLFEANVLLRAQAAIRELMRDGPLDGFILDLRTNGGGTYANLRGLLALFASGQVGQFVSRNGTTTPLRVRAAGIGNSQRVPLVVLVGGETESFAEVLAGALRAAGRATLIGQNTAGNVETLIPHEFEDGSRLWLAEETFRLPDGSGWEGSGLIPDVLIPVGWDEYTEESDPVLAAALKRFGLP